MVTPDAAILTTCLVDLVYPDTGVAMVRLLRRHGVRVSVPPDQTCCGLLFFNSGYRGEAARLARRTIACFAAAEQVVVPSGSCAWMVKGEYPRLFPGDARLTDAARSLAARTFELSQFLLRATGAEGAERDSEASGDEPRPRVTYHDSCHLLRGLGESGAPRALIRRAGVDLVELAGADECCGFGGSFSVRLGDVSGAILISPGRPASPRWAPSATAPTPPWETASCSGPWRRPRRGSPPPAGRPSPISPRAIASGRRPAGSRSPRSDTSTRTSRHWPTTWSRPAARSTGPATRRRPARSSSGWPGRAASGWSSSRSRWSPRRST